MKSTLGPVLAGLLSIVLFHPLALVAAEKSNPTIIHCSDQQALAAQIGKKVSVEGLVQSTGKGGKDGVRFLNLSTNPRTGFVAAIFPSAYKDVGPIEKYQGKNIRVTGTLEHYRKQTEIKVFHASQVQILAASGTAQ